MSDATITKFATVDQLQLQACESFYKLAHEVVDKNDIMRVSLSGGSTPKRLYELLSKRDLPWDKIHWFLGDERNVSHEHADSNFKMVREALLNHVDVPEGNIHPVPVNVDDPAKAAREYETTLKQHFGNSFPNWDLALLGMGDDAHTASLFPGTLALEQTERWFVENWVEKFDAYRYTLTAPAINSATEIWFLIAGSAKQSALAAVMGSDRNPDQYPSQLISPTQWLVTEDAWPNQ